MAQFPTLTYDEIDAPVKLVFFALLVLFVTVISGLAPALYASGVNLNTYLKAGSDSKTRCFPFSFSLRELITGVQISLALALLTGVCLLVNSMIFHVDVPIRWASRDMAVVRATLESNPYTQLSGSSLPTGNAMANYSMFFQEFQNRLSTMPEVVSAGIFKPIPFSAEAARTSQLSTTVVFKTPPGTPERVFHPIFEGRASPEGFYMMGLPVIAGRTFSSIDMANEIEFRISNREALFTKGRAIVGQTGGVVIVNQTLARQFWPGENAVGKIIYCGVSNAYEVVGVVPDIHLVSDNKNVVPTVYYPPDSYNQSQTFIVKLHSRAFMQDFRQRLAGFDAGLITIEVQSLGELVSKATTDIRLTLQLLGIFTLLGIVVAGLGVYATTSLMIAAMNREMGLRMAIGARTWDILRLALWRGTRAIFFGLPFGLFLAWIISRILSSYLFQVNVNDPLVWIISCALLLAITIIAAFIPALRAIRVNPMDAIRNE
jgi:hypothetical protein